MNLSAANAQHPSGSAVKRDRLGRSRHRALCRATGPDFGLCKMVLYDWPRRTAESSPSTSMCPARGTGWARMSRISTSRQHGIASFAARREIGELPLIAFRFRAGDAERGDGRDRLPAQVAFICMRQVVVHQARTWPTRRKRETLLQCTEPNRDLSARMSESAGRYRRRLRRPVWSRRD
jgi:hypothetical protein